MELRFIGVASSWLHYSFILGLIVSFLSEPNSVMAADNMPTNDHQDAIKACSTSSGTNELVYRVNETNGNAPPSLILDMNEDIAGSFPDTIDLALLENPGEYFSLVGKELHQQQILDRDDNKLDHLELKLLCAYIEQGVQVEKEIKVSVLVDDVNDHIPAFIDEPYAVNISKSIKIGDLIFSGIKAVDLDAGKNADIEFFIARNESQPESASDYFEIKDPKKGHIILKRQLDKEIPNGFQIGIGVRDNPADASLRRSSYSQVAVRLVDNTEHAPVFLHPACTQDPNVCADVDYVARASAGEIVHLDQAMTISPVQIQAVDPDTTHYPVVYAFANGTPEPYDSYFAINSVTGEVRQIQDIPYGLVEKFVIYVVASKRGGHGLFSMARLTINVDNSIPNHHAPVLQISSLEGFIEENSRIGALVRISPNPGTESVQILVSDEDLKPGMPPATYQYILTGAGAAIFAVNQAGYVYLNIPNLNADVPNPSTYPLTIQAVEVGTTPLRNSEKVTIIIRVIDINDHSPLFESPTVSVRTTSEPGIKEILKIRATDQDSGPFGDIVYTISSVSDNADYLFRYDRNRGALLSLGALTPGKQYQLILEAKDGGGKKADATITVDVEPLHGQQPGPPIEPTFLPPPSAVPTNLPSPPVFQPSPTDEPHSKQTEISGFRPPPQLPPFGIQGPPHEPIPPQFPPITWTPQFTTAEPTPEAITLPPPFIPSPIRPVGDLDEFSNNNNNNNAAPIMQNVVNITEGIPANTVILSLKATATTGVPLRYKILRGNEQGRFYLNSSSGALSTLTPLDRESTAAYNLVIEAAGGVGLRNQTAIMLQLTDENDNAPTILNPQPIHFTVTEGAANTIVGKINAIDADEGENSRITFGFQTSNEFFDIDEQSGVIKTLGPLAADSQPYDLTVVASDNGSPPLTTTIPVNELKLVASKIAISVMSDGRDRMPYFKESQYTVDVRENAGQVTLLTVKATDPDQIPQITYFLRHGDPTLFTIDSASGTISTLANLDAEILQQHTLIIGTTQNPGQQPPDVTVVLVNVQDVNDWIPVFKPTAYRMPIAENTPAGTSLLQLNAMDGDVSAPNNVVRYALASSPATEASEQFFHIDATSGLITTTKLLRSIPDDLMLHVQATDLGQPPLSSTATIAFDLQRIPTPPTVEPTFLPTNILSSLQPETQQPSNVIPTASSSSQSQQNTRPMTPQPVRFSLNKHSTLVSEAVEPPFLIQLLPVLNKPENAAAEVSCRIASGNYGGVFSVSTSQKGDCQLFVISPLDRENITDYRLNITLGTSFAHPLDSTEVNVQVTDANDNGPVFQFPYQHLGLHTYFAALSTDAPPLSTLLQASPVSGKNKMFLEAVDADENDNANITYSLAQFYATVQYFKVNAKTGEVQNTQSLSELPTKSPPYYEFKVSAQDNPIHGRPMITGADVVVNAITNANRVVLVLEGLLPEAAQSYISDIASTLQSRSGHCQVIGFEQLLQSAELTKENKPGTEIWFYAINPTSKTICLRNELRSLLSDESVQHIRGQHSGKFYVREIRAPMASVGTAGGAGVSSSEWNGAQIAIVVLAGIIVVGCLVAMFFLCCWWSKYKSSKVVMTEKPHLYSILPSYNALMLPPSEKEYETQILEMIMPDDSPSKDPGDGGFTLDEGVYRLRPNGNQNIYGSPMINGLIIPPPDYPTNSYSPEADRHSHHPQQAQLHRSMQPAANGRTNREKTTIL